MLIESTRFFSFFKKGVLPRLSVVYGSDVFFKTQLMDFIRNLFRAKEEFSERLVFDCRKSAATYSGDLKLLKQNCSLLSLFRLFEINCISSQVDELLKCFYDDDHYTFCVLILDDVSWRDKKSCWFTDGHKSEEVFFFPCETPTSGKFVAWIDSLLEYKGMVCSADVSPFLAAFFEGNAWGVYQALECLSLYQESREVTIESLQSCIFSATRYKVDDCIQAIFVRDRQRFVRVLCCLRESDESLMSLLVWRMSSDLRVCCAYYSESPTNPKQIDLFFQKRKIFGIRRSFFLQAVKFLKEADIVRALSCLSSIDKKHKGLMLGNPWEDFFWTGLFLMRD